METKKKTNQKKISVKETVIFGMLGALMYASKIIMEALPNIHLLGVFTIAFTLVYRKKALYPIYTYVLLNGIFAGFAAWWIPHLYLWTILWVGTMLLPKNIPFKLRPLVYMLLNACHGLVYGILYAPTQAIIFGLSIEGMKAWIIAGLPWDALHGVSNFICGMLILPIVKILKKIEKL
jgi:energy-coupling factor transport system substrate-specific component